MEKKQLTVFNRHEKRMPSTLYVPEKSSKGTCVVLHGLGGWREQSVVVAAATAAVAAGYQALTYDASNSALAPDSDFVNATITTDIEDLEDMLAFVRAQSWYEAPLTLIGHSMGGLTAVEYAAHHPHEIEKIALCAPGVSWRFFRGSFLWIALLWYVRGVRYTPGPHGKKYALSRNWLDDFFQFDIYRRARTISIPVLVVAAEKDTAVATPKKLRKLAQRFPQGTYAVVYKAPHTFFRYETPLTAILSKWLTQY